MVVIQTFPQLISGLPARLPLCRAWSRHPCSKTTLIKNGYDSWQFVKIRLHLFYPLTTTVFFKWIPTGNKQYMMIWFQMSCPLVYPSTKKALTTVPPRFSKKWYFVSNSGGISLHKTLISIFFGLSSLYWTP